MKESILPRKQIVRSALLAGAALVAASGHAQDGASDQGTWDGVTASAALAGPYEDRLQQEVPFGTRSYYLTPWRAYMDTWPASKFLNVLGIQFNVDAAEADAVAKLLGEAGFRSARIEVGWGNFQYDAPATLPENRAKDLATKLQALQKNGIRPLILLNANSGGPVPMKTLRVRVTQEAPVGAREIVVERTEGIVPGFTGPRGQAYQIAYPLITGIDSAAGKVTLSAPLKKAIPAGALDLLVLRYHPFGGAVFEDGTANPQAQATLDGWRDYVAAVCGYVQESLGTKGKPDAGFDLEVWNEYTFGSQFLEEKNYYDPPRKFKEPVVYTNHGRTRKGHEAILPMTIDYVNDPANGLPGVRVISGFSNQRPWDNGAEMWPGQAGFSRHYYTGIEPGDWAGGGGLLAPGKDTKADQDILNALGESDGRPAGPNAPRPFTPTLHVAMPEWWHYAYKTEFMTRDIQPVPGPWEKHGRYTHPGTGRPAEVWMTEFNLWRRPWAESLMKKASVGDDDPRLVALMHEIGAKALVRSFVFYSHKGVQTMDVYAAKAEDTHFAVIPEAFYTTLKAAKGTLSGDARYEAGRQLEVIGRVSALMRQGKPLETPRPLRVEKLVERKPRLVFRGDGTPAHPDRYHRDDFAVLPFQLDAGRYAVGYYVVTRNMIHEWQPAKDTLDPSRYAMPDQEFEITLGNVRGSGARVSVLDPMTGATLPAQSLASTGTTLTVRVPAADYPRFLLIDEAKPGPLIASASLVPDADEAATLRFSTNVKAPATVTWGPLPDRRRGGVRTLPAAVAQQMTLPSLRASHGVRISISADGLTARWPLWDADARGVARFTGVEPGTEPSRLPTLRLPPLPATPRPVRFTTTLPGTGAVRRTAVGTGTNTVEAELHITDTAAEEALSVLPEVATTDRVEIRVVDWSGVRAWRVDLALDPAAHPGLQQPRQRYLMMPLTKGLAVFVFRGTEAGFQANVDAMDKLADTIRWEQR